jgi:DNA (cytosine-5)-methyltransferase 1
MLFDDFTPKLIGRGSGLNYIDLFAGAGGLSEGFIRNGFVPVAHVEMNKFAAQTLKTRMAYHYLKEVNRLDIYYAYISGKISSKEFYSHIPLNIQETVINREISDETIKEIFNDIEKNMARIGCKNIDVIVGGPPCQAYSLVGRARDPYNKEHDPRNYLYRQYVKFLVKFSPRLFVFENVPGILTAAKGRLFEDVKRYMNEAGYDIDAKILDASDFGVLQQRKRVILIGWQKGLNYKYPQFQKIEHTYKVNDLLSDLPKLKPGEKIHFGSYTSDPTEYVEKFGIRKSSDILTQHITRIHNERDREIYRLTIQLWNKEKRRLKYHELPKELRTHKNLHSFLDRFKVVGAEEPYSHTMVAHIAKDGHYYIHPDINQLRSLSVREAARIQSFPDNYFFEGSRTAAFNQIGNAVPPIMAELIAKEIKKMMSE